MERKMVERSIPVDGMTCVQCENRIETTLAKAKGIHAVRADYSKSSVTVTYNEGVILLADIEKIIESLDYQVRREPVKPVRKTAAKTESPSPLSPPAVRITRILGVAILLAALYVILKQVGGLAVFNTFPQAEQGMGYGLLLGIGLLTSVHCVAMCGGINLSQCVPLQPAADRVGTDRVGTLMPSLLYNAGRVISYTVIGGVVGALGSVVSFSGWAKGLVAIVAGVFMVIMGLNMLDLFPWLHKLNPRLPRVFARRINKEKQSRGNPLVVGLLNGLMPCGPLQAMQLYALSTGSPVKGALAMFLFSLGTVPLMFGLGALSSLLSRRFTRRMMQVSAVLVVILGVFMFQNGLGLSGVALPQIPAGVPGQTAVSAPASGSNIVDGVQIVKTGLPGGNYEPITVQAGIPVRWTITADPGTVTGCNNRMLIPAYGIEKQLFVGENVIEFTPDKTGTVPYSCWMGMIRSKITVVGG